MMDDRRDARQDPQKEGLCAACTQARRIQSDRGSVFLRCERSATDSRYAKYPRLPMLVCDGYERMDDKQ